MNPTPHLRSALTAALLSAFAALPTGWAADSTWSQNSAGTFSTPGNWSAGVPGDASGSASSDVATFIRSTITASRLVTLDSSRNLAGITLDNDNTSSFAYQIGGSSFGGATTGTLTLSPNAQILVTGSGSTNSTHGLDANMVLSGKASIINNFSTSIFQFGNSGGTSANTVTTGTGLGAVDLVLGGTSTGSNLMSMRLNQDTDSTLRLVKEGAGFWQINGKSTGTQGLTGGLLVREGSVSIGRNSALSIGTGTVVLGDNTTPSGDISFTTGSGVTLTNNFTIAASNANNVIIERLGTGGQSIYQGTITLERDLVLRQRTTGTAQNLNIASGSVLTGTGNVIIDTTLANATGAVILGGGSFSGAGSINMNGKIINQSSTGAAGLNITGKVLSNVTEIVQNSTTSLMTISHASNTFGKTTVSAGTISVSGTGVLGTGDVTVANGATLTLGNVAGLQDTSTLFFGSTSTINLNFSGTETVNMLASIGGSYAAPATYSAAQLNTLFGGSVFSGTGSLLVLAAIPEPSSFVALAGLGVLALAASRRRARR